MRGRQSLVSLMGKVDVGASNASAAASRAGRRATDGNHTPPRKNPRRHLRDAPETADDVAEGCREAAPRRTNAFGTPPGRCRATSREARDVARAPGRPVLARRTLEKNPSRDIDRCSRCRVAAAPKHPRWGSANSVAREDARRTYPVRRHVSGLLWTTCCRACRRGRVCGFFIPFVVSPSLRKIGILGFSRVFVWKSVSKFAKFTKP